MIPDYCDKIMCMCIMYGWSKPTCSVFPLLALLRSFTDLFLLYKSSLNEVQCSTWQVTPTVLQPQQLMTPIIFKPVQYQLWDLSSVQHFWSDIVGQFDPLSQSWRNIIVHHCTMDDVTDKSSEVLYRNARWSIRIAGHGDVGQRLWSAAVKSFSIWYQLMFIFPLV